MKNSPPPQDQMRPYALKSGEGRVYRYGILVIKAGELTRGVDCFTEYDLQRRGTAGSYASNGRRDLSCPERRADFPLWR
jgi:hypothetical protein